MLLRTKKEEYLKNESNESATNSKTRERYEPGSNLVENENGEVLADSHNILIKR
jgi:hypothetical protein